MCTVSFGIDGYFPFTPLMLIDFHDPILLSQKDLMTVLISQTDISQPDLRSSVLAALDGDTDNLLAIEE